MALLFPFVRAGLRDASTMGQTLYIPKPAGAADTPGTSTVSHTFVQKRVALFALALFLLGLIYLVFRSTMSLAAGRLPLAHPSMLFHLLGMASNLVVWLIARRGRYQLHTIRALEYGAVFVSSAFYVLMAVLIPVALRPDFILVLCLTFIVMARSILVPSTAGRTGVTVALLGVMLVAGAYWASLGADLTPYPAIFRNELRPVPSAIRSGAWWLLTSGLAVLTSSVIYGLQREIHQAKRLGQYALEEKLGEGGMGVVYRASHAMLRRPTAVKLLAPHKAGEETIARFEREVRLTARLNHPNTVTIYDYGRTPEGIFYYAMELLDGLTLEEVVDASGAQPAGRVLHIGSQIASALVEAHGAGLIHRDIKPANAILCERAGLSDVVKVVDFGLVRDLEAGANALSRAGIVSGTPLYLAPEAIRAPDSVDARADLYALGGVLYYLLAGDHVFRGGSTMEICAHHLHTAPRPIGERAAGTLPAGLASIVMDCLSKEPAARPPSAEVLLDRLRGCAADCGWSPRQARAWWDEHGAKAKAARVRKESSSGSTIAIDLQRR